MHDPVVEGLVLDLLEWRTKRDRTYEEVMDAWRTSCPKLPIWEDANDRGLIMNEMVDGRCIVRISPSGHDLLAERRNLVGWHCRHFRYNVFHGGRSYYHPNSANPRAAPAPPLPPEGATRVGARARSLGNISGAGLPTRVRHSNWRRKRG